MTSATVHPTAIVDSGARLGPDVEVGPYAVVGEGVELGARTRVGAHASLEGPLVVGEDCWIGPSAAIGLAPQIKGTASGGGGGTRIGKGSVIRELSQIHRAADPDRETRLGEGCYLMAASHVAHDCVLGRDVCLCNNALIAGHVEVGDRAFVSGNSVVHQFCRIGELAFVGGLSAVQRDVPPFGLVAGQRPPALMGLNVVGLRRAGIAGEVRRELGRAFRILFRSALGLPERLAAAQAEGFVSDEVQRLLAFVQASKRGVIGFGGRPRSLRSEAPDGLDRLVPRPPREGSPLRGEHALRTSEPAPSPPPRRP